MLNVFTIHLVYVKSYITYYHSLICRDISPKYISLFIELWSHCAKMAHRESIWVLLIKCS